MQPAERTRDILSDGSEDSEEDDLRPQTPPASLHVTHTQRERHPSPSAFDNSAALSQAHGYSRRRGPKNRALRNVMECRQAVRDARHWQKREQLLNKQLESEQGRLHHDQLTRTTLLRRFDETEDVKRAKEMFDHEAKIAVEKLQKRIRREKAQQRKAVRVARADLLTRRQHLREAEQFRQRERTEELETKREVQYLRNKEQWKSVQEDRRVAQRAKAEDKEIRARRARHAYEVKQRAIEEDKQQHLAQADEAMQRSSQLAAILDRVRAMRVQRGGGDPFPVSPDSLRASMHVTLDM